MTDEDARRVTDRILQLFRERINFNKILDEVSYEVYDKYYTADELKDLIAFYKSPTGQKAIKVMPQVFADSTRLTGEKLMPQLQPSINQVMEEEKQRIDKEVEPLTKPAPKPRSSRRRRRA